MRCAFLSIFKKHSKYSRGTNNVYIIYDTFHLQVTEIAEESVPVVEEVEAVNSELSTSKAQLAKQEADAIAAAAAAVSKLTSSDSGLNLKLTSSDSLDELAGLQKSQVRLLQDFFRMFHPFTSYLILYSPYSHFTTTTCLHRPIIRNRAPRIGRQWIV